MTRLAGCSSPVIPRDKPTVQAAETASNSRSKKSAFGSISSRLKKPMKISVTAVPLVVSCWGSLGAREMNKKIAQFMKCECEDNTPFHHIHATGSFGWRWMPDYVKEQGVDLAAHPALDMREYIYDMPQVLAAADLIICRAGAATIAEVCASGTPCRAASDCSASATALPSVALAKR